MAMNNWVLIMLILILLLLSVHMSNNVVSLIWVTVVLLTLGLKSDSLLFPLVKGLIDV
jgi:hypothetical protein